MDTFDRVTAVALTAVVASLTAIAIPNLMIARNRSRHRRTMQTMREAATRYEQGQPIGKIEDGWGNPMRVRARSTHYSIRAAGRDGIFEPDTASIAFRLTTSFDEDLLFVDGNFAQMPEGI